VNYFTLGWHLVDLTSFRCHPGVTTGQNGKKVSMLITLPPQAVFDFENTLSQRPQHQELIFTDPNDSDLVQRYTIYTGELFSPGGGPLLNAGSSHQDLTFQFPLIGTFVPPPPGGPPTIGIKPIGEDREHNTFFRSAVAEAAVTSAEWGINPVWTDITSVSADLIRIALDSGQQINAVALMGMLTSRNSQITRISYRVTVLDRQAPQGNVRPPPPRFIAPILKGFSGWTGKYIGSGSLVREGIPQDKID
jgi:hypothetical protein